MLDRDLKCRLEQVQLLAAGVDPLPREVQWLLGDKEASLGDDLAVAIEQLRERVIGDSGVTVERAALFRWLIHCDMAIRRLRGGWRGVEPRSVDYSAASSPNR